MTETCPCGARAVDAGLRADCINPPNPVCGSCGCRHMQPYPGGSCPR